MTLADIPFFSHHKDTLNEQAFENLRANSLEETQDALVVNDKLHHFNEALEGFPISSWGWLGLQADLGNNQGLSRNRCQCL